MSNTSDRPEDDFESQLDQYEFFQSEESFSSMIVNGLSELARLHSGDTAAP